ncbi:hypothetical protein [Furfurilactobacillus cerevisiae]
MTTMMNQLKRNRLFWLLCACAIVLPLGLTSWLASLRGVEFATVVPILAQTRVFVFFLSWVVPGILLSLAKKENGNVTGKHRWQNVFLMTLCVDIALMVVNQVTLLTTGTLFLGHTVAFPWQQYWQMQLGLFPLIASGQVIYEVIGIHKASYTATMWWSLAATFGLTFFIAVGRLMFDWSQQLRLISVFSLVSAGYWNTWNQVLASWISSVITCVLAVVISYYWLGRHEHSSK